MFQPIDSVSLTRRFLSDATIIGNTAQAHHHHLRADGGAEPDALTPCREQIRRGPVSVTELSHWLLGNYIFLVCKTRRRLYLSH